MKTLIQIDRLSTNGGSVSTTVTYHGNVLFKKGFTHRFFSVGKNLGAWHIFGFRFSFYVCNTSDINPHSLYYQKPLLHF